jgi:glutathione synthase/RimK-type ligase-like ATP-grasp enzyme
VVVFIKRRPAAERFANANASVSLARPQDVFSDLEIAQLSAFAHAMRLDWGGLDVLRDRPSGRLYVVDVNKTDMGPPIALPFADKLRAVARMGRALKRLITEQAP